MFQCKSINWVIEDSNLLPGFHKTMFQKTNFLISEWGHISYPRLWDIIRDKSGLFLFRKV